MRLCEKYQFSSLTFIPIHIACNIRPICFHSSLKTNNCMLCVLYGIAVYFLSLTANYKEDPYKTKLMCGRRTLKLHSSITVSARCASGICQTRIRTHIIYSQFDVVFLFMQLSLFTTASTAHQIVI